MSLLILFPKLGQEIEELVRNAQNVTKYLLTSSPPFASLLDGDS